MVSYLDTNTLSNKLEGMMIARLSSQDFRHFTLCVVAQLQLWAARVEEKA